MIKDMCKDAGIEEKTNHSLRATGRSAMFQANVTEKIIQNTTGHRSLEAPRKYQHTLMEQHQAVSQLLMSGKSCSVKSSSKQQSTSPGSRFWVTQPTALLVHSQSMLPQVQLLLVLHLTRLSLLWKKILMMTFFFLLTLTCSTM